ncbi:MAG: hypothetical protein OEZ08_13880 [Betaproteobacteria bacterium]|nr:hypothetical protein [Betaproteobacteria bacterium]
MSQHMDEGCSGSAASLCPQRTTRSASMSGPAALNVPPAAVASMLILPGPPLSVDPAAIDRCPADAIPRLSKSVLFCTWLN